MSPSLYIFLYFPLRCFFSFHLTFLLFITVFHSLLPSHFLPLVLLLFSSFLPFPVLLTTRASLVQPLCKTHDFILLLGHLRPSQHPSYSLLSIPNALPFHHCGSSSPSTPLSLSSHQLPLTHTASPRDPLCCTVSHKNKDPPLGKHILTHGLSDLVTVYVRVCYIFVFYGII